MDFFKGLVPGTVLTLVLAGILGKNHYDSSWLSIFHQTIQGMNFYWSWPIFIGGTILSWALFAMSPK